MPTRTATPHRPRRGALRSPLAAATQSPLPPICPPGGTGPAPSQPTAAEPRALTLAEFGDYLRTINNRDGWPCEDITINAYVFPAKALDAWMTARKARVPQSEAPWCWSAGKERSEHCARLRPSQM